MRLNLSKREISGVLVAPLTAFTIFIILIGSFGLRAIEFGRIVIYAIVFAYGGMFLFGLPIIVALKKTGDLRLLPLLFFGGIAGLFVYPFAIYVFTKGESELNVGPMFFGFFEGMIVALTYGIIANVKIRGSAP